MCQERAVHTHPSQSLGTTYGGLVLVLSFPACPVSAQGVSKLGERNAAHVSRELQGERPYGVSRMCKFFAATSSSILKAPKALKNYSVLCSCGQNLPVRFVCSHITAIIGHKLPNHRAQDHNVYKPGWLIQPWEHPTTSVHSQHRGLWNQPKSKLLFLRQPKQSQTNSLDCAGCSEVGDGSWKHVGSSAAAEPLRMASGKNTGMAWDRSPDRGTGSEHCTAISWGRCGARIWGQQHQDPWGRWECCGSHGTCRGKKSKVFHAPLSKAGWRISPDI